MSSWLLLNVTSSAGNIIPFEWVRQSGPDLACVFDHSRQLRLKVRPEYEKPLGNPLHAKACLQSPGLLQLALRVVI
jgi:hypothetical protein